MIICTNCNHEELVGTLFCSLCGIQLDSMQRENPLFTVQSEIANHPFPVNNLHDYELDINSSHSIRIIETGDIIPLIDNDIFTLGREAPGQSLIPDIDLTSYQGEKDGVSRLHATIKIRGNRLFIKDLGSVNGTWINGKTITPNTDFPLHHKDVISLGNFSLQILIF